MSTAYAQIAPEKMAQYGQRATPQRFGLVNVKYADKTKGYAM
jgi:hypothetical protein